MTAFPIFPGRVENRSARGRIVLVCEHASNAFPDCFGDLGLTEAQRQAHIAWDPGALMLARDLGTRLDAAVVHAPVSRLIYDCNRAPDQTGAMAKRSEVHDIPGNAALSPEDRAARVEAVYVPFHATLHGVIAERLARGLSPVIVTVHSFTPVYAGVARAVEFGVIHDTDPVLARSIAAQDCGLATALNAPYSAADDVTHTLRLQALPYGLPNAMLEIRNDLLTTPAATASVADRIAPVLSRALETLVTAKAG